MTRAVLLYSAVSIGLIALVAWLFTVAFATAGSAEAIRLSAIVAIVVQVGAFSATKVMVRRNLVAAWGAGTLLRLFTLILYGLVAVKLLGLAATPALLSLVAFFFLSTLLEPLFLRR